MPAVYQIMFHPSGDVRAFYGSRGNHYELDDGSHIDLKSEPVWCHGCADFTDGELVEGLEEIDQQIADLRDPTSQLFQFFQEKVTGAIDVAGIRLIMSLEKRRRWRKCRESPPKCLVCGSTEIVGFPDGQKVRNPTGHGWIEVTVSGLCSTAFNNRFYTPEGDRIARDTKPTYWSLP